MPKDINEIIFDYFNKKISKKDYQRLLQWVESSQENRTAFESLIKANHLSNLAVMADCENIKQRFLLTIEKAKRRRTLRRFMRISSSAAAILVLSVLSYFSLNKINEHSSVENVKYSTIAANNVNQKVTLSVFKLDRKASSDHFTVDSTNLIKKVEIDSVHSQKAIAENENNIYSVKVPNKLSHKVVLPDGTRVWINSDSELKYPSKFTSETREVYLEGEAYFEVTKNEKKPFIVSTQNTTVKVLGTSFNINSYPNNETIKTTLITGKVQLIVGDSKCDLLPGTIAESNRTNNEINVRSCDIDKELSWMEGVYYFDATPLKEILYVISRWYDVSFTFIDNSPKTLTFTGMINKKMQIDEIIYMLFETVDFTYTKESISHYTIYSN